MALTGAIGQSQEPDRNTPLHFETDIRIIFKTHCWHCHGEEPEVQAKLDLRLARSAITGGESGPAIVAGDTDKSLLWLRVEADEMPPGGKHLSQKEKQKLRRWIVQGAKTLRAEPDSPEHAALWTEEERNYWAFQPLHQAPAPAVQVTDQVINPIDSFVLSRLESNGLTFSAIADRVTLARRLSFDLLGRPPEFSAVEQFVSDPSVDAYERLVDSMLTSPEYGERWSRHWLDAAGYADSDGYSEADVIRPWAFRYRDYVIQSLNRDKPWNEFIVEQLAGDELVPPPYENLLPESIERLTATGFLRMAPDGTGDAGVDSNVAKNDCIADTIKIVSTSLMGLTVGCAQCHNHRYDPISQVDYFRLRAAFEPALDWKNWRDKPSKLVSLWQPSDRQQAADVDKELAELEGTRVKELDEIVQSIFDREVDKLPEDKRDLARQARATSADKRNDEHKALFKDFPSLNVDRGSAVLYEAAKINEFNKRYESKQAELRVKRPADSFVAALFEPTGHIPPTHLFYRGDFNQLRQQVEPGDLSIMQHGVRIDADDPQLPTSGRRLALAKLWTNGQHPLLPRAVMNRVWLHHFGRGISNTPGDFGQLGQTPTHPELLDWLASEWIGSNWSLKHIHRLILNSRTYRQASARTEQLEAIDPENKLLGRMPLRRLESEAIRDSMLAMTGRLYREMFGPAIPINPDDVGQAIIGSATRDGNGISVAKSEELQQYRKSIYLQVRRSLPFGMLEAFDPPTQTPNCDRRGQSTVAPQSLLLMNNHYAIQYAERFAENVVQLAGEDFAAQVRLVHQTAFSREPSSAALETAIKWLQNEKAHFDQLAADKPATPDAKKEPSGMSSSTQALALYCQAIMSSNAFLYVD